jgi:hypothetical protein
MTDPGKVRVVVADKRDIVGHFEAGVVCCRKRADAGDVIEGNYRRRSVPGRQQALTGSVSAFLTHASGHHPGLQARSLHGMLISRAPQPADAVRALHVGYPGMAQGQKVLCRLARSGLVIVDNDVVREGPPDLRGGSRPLRGRPG